MKQEHDPGALNHEYFPEAPGVADLVVAPMYLRLMNETSLARAPAGASTCYRLLWLRSFRPAMSIRIEGPDREQTLVAKAWAGMPLENKGQLVLNQARRLDAAESQNLQRLLDDAAFWRLESSDARMGLDGAFLILEGRSGNEHHVVMRWSPESDGPDRAFLELCEFMIGLSSS